MSIKQIQIRCKGTSTLPLDSFQNLQGNLKELMEPEYKKLRRSIEKYGFRFPIFVWGNMILDGHQRILVIKKMVSEGWSIDPIPIVEIEADNEKEAKRLVLLVSSRYGHVTDEGLYEFIMTSELNFDELKEEIDLPEIDFKQFEQSYFTDEPKDAEPQIDRAEELNKKWQVKMGDLWQIGEHRLLCGDSTKAEDVARVMVREKVSIITDPPYGIGVDTSWLSSLNMKRGKPPNKSDDRLQGDNGTLDLSWLYRYPEWLVFGFPFIARFEAYTGLLVWDKRGDGGEGGLGNPVEVAASNAFNGYRLFRHVWAGYIRETGERRESHPTQKPIGIMADAIELVHSKIIFDPFLGSGTTMVACQNLNRKCRGIEISQNYCSVVLERMKTAFPGIEIKRIDGERSRT